MQKINLDLLDAAEPRGFEQLSPATPSEGPRSPRSIMRYNMMVCALLVLLPPVLAFGGLELVRMLDEQTEASLRSVTTVRHAAPAATRGLIEPTMEEVRPATLLQPHARAAGPSVAPPLHACKPRTGARHVRPLRPVCDAGAPHRARHLRRLPCVGGLIVLALRATWKFLLFTTVSRYLWLSCTHRAAFAFFRSLRVVAPLYCIWVGALAAC